MSLYGVKLSSLIFKVLLKLNCMLLINNIEDKLGILYVHRKHYFSNDYDNN